MPNDGDLLDALDDYAPEPEMKQAILVDNPARLYGLRLSRLVAGQLPQDVQVVLDTP